MKKKLMALILSAAMSATLLTGCGGGANDDVSQNDATGDNAADDGVQEIKWMFWDDFNATEDLISKGYDRAVQ